MNDDLPTYEKGQKIKKYQTFNFDEFSFWGYTPLYLSNIMYLTQILRALLSNNNGILHY